MAAVKSFDHVPYFEELFDPSASALAAYRQVSEYLSTAPRPLHGEEARANRAARELGFPPPWLCIWCQNETHIDESLYRVSPPPGGPNSLVVCQRCRGRALTGMRQDVRRHLIKQVLVAACATGAVGFLVWWFAHPGPA